MIWWRELQADHRQDRWTVSAKWEVKLTESTDEDDIEAHLMFERVMTAHGIDELCWV